MSPRILSLAATCVACACGASSGPAATSDSDAVGEGGAAGSGVNDSSGDASTETGGGRDGSVAGRPDAGGDGASRDAGKDGSTPAAGPAFPRLGSLLIATDNSMPNVGYDSGYAQWASKIHVNVMGANWVGAGASLLGGSREALVKAIHAQSKIGARVIQYFITDNTKYDWPMASVQSWVLYQHGTSGACASDNPGLCNTNPTLYMPADANGLHLEGEFAQALIATLVQGSTADAAPSMDGTFHDNTNLTPAVAGDYARNGTQEPIDDPTAGQWIRAGEAEGYAYEQAHSGLLTTGNLGGWGLPPGSVGGGMDASGLSTLVQGGVVEGEFGDTWSAETWSGFAAAKVHYQFCMTNTAAPRLVIVHHSNLAPNGSDPYGPSYQAMRYGLAFTLMDDGYYGTTRTESYLNTERNWFDEFSVDPTTGVALEFPDVEAGLGYLGQPTDPSWPAPLANGVYTRRFHNETAGSSWLVLLNPKGNGVQTVKLAQPMKKLTGTQDPTINDGSTVTSVTLQDRDGLILKNP